jgi:hypothetical protein
MCGPGDLLVVFGEEEQIVRFRERMQPRPPPQSSVGGLAVRPRPHSAPIAPPSHLRAEPPPSAPKTDGVIEDIRGVRLARVQEHAD